MTVTGKTRRSESTGCQLSPVVLTISMLCLARHPSTGTVSVATSPDPSPSGWYGVREQSLFIQCILPVLNSSKCAFSHCKKWNNVCILT